MYPTLISDNNLVILLMSCQLTANKKEGAKNAAKEKRCKNQKTNGNNKGKGNTMVENAPNGGAGKDDRQAHRKQQAYDKSNGAGNREHLPKRKLLKNLVFIR